MATTTLWHTDTTTGTDYFDVYGNTTHYYGTTQIKKEKILKAALDKLEARVAAGEDTREIY